VRCSRGAPEAAAFTWRASSKWQNGVHSETKIQNFFGLGQEQSHKDRDRVHRRPPRGSSRPPTTGITPIEYLPPSALRALPDGGPWQSVAQNRGIQLALGRVDRRRQPRHPRDPRCRQRRAPTVFNDIHRDIQDRCGRFTAKRSKRWLPQSQKRSAVVLTALTNPTNVTVAVA